MTLKLQGSTSGHTAIEAPASAGSNTIVLPANNGSANQYLKNTGTAGTLEFASLGALGKILGYAHLGTSSATNVSALASFTEIGSFALSYTPTVATSKLLFIAQLNLTVRAVNTSYYGHMQVRFKHGSIATSEHWDLYRGTGSGTGTAHSFPYTFVHEFSATNTTARDTTVELHNASSTGGSNNGHLYFNEYSGRSSMTILEVAA